MSILSSQLGLLLLLLGLSAFFSGSETALFSLSKLQIHRLQRKFSHRGTLVSSLLSQPYQLLSTIVIGNMLVNVAATSLATLIAIRLWGEIGVSLSIILMTLLIITFGEITPKTYAVQRAERVVLKIIYPIKFFLKFFLPIRKILTNVTDFFISHLGGKISVKKPYLTEKELQNLIKIGKKEGVVKETEEEMIYSVFEFGDTDVNEIMIPRVDMVALQMDAPAEDVIKFMRKAKHARIPLYGKNLDDIAGVIHTKDYLLSENKNIKRLMKAAVLIPETKKIDEMLKEFQKKNLQMAIIVDEYGGTAGLITLEDILEEIVGEIQDEFEPKEKLIETLDKKSAIINGKLELSTVNRKLDLNLPEEESDTIGGFVFSLFGRIPKQDEKISFKNLTFTVKKMGKNRIRKILLEIK
ncbi:MAG: hemolysin family protein [Candidatus Ratteibacteria bacterium]|nr:hemolysin family protein [Candidatus Ratteibacteria bacterium]